MAKVRTEDFPLTLTMNVETAISSYFSYAENALKTYETYRARKRELDYLKMQRFLQTAYKTLMEIDPEFMAYKLIRLHEHLEAMARIYEDFDQKGRVGIHSYEIIFLRRQEGYADYEKRLQSNADEITYLRGQTERFKDSVMEQKERLEKSSKLTGDYDRQEQELKRLKRRENSAIVRLGTLVEENLVLSEVLRKFKGIYEDAFVTAFARYIHKVRPALLSVLNSMAYEFDVEMWHKAKESSIIRNHFKNAYAGEVVSSRSYLTYYLKNLDQNKLSKEHQELKKLLAYLNQTHDVKILIYMLEIEDANSFETAIEADNGGFQIAVFIDPKKALAYAIKESVQLIFLDQNIQQNILENFLKTYRENLPVGSEKAKLVMVCDEINERAIALASKYSSDSLIEREIDPVEVIDTVYTVLDIS